MEKSSFKKSKLKNIPESWKVKKIGDIGNVIGGGTPSTKEKIYYNGSIPWITPKDLSNYYSVFIEKGERNITKEGLDSSSATLMPAGAVLFSSRAPIGYVAIAKNEVSTNQGFKSIVCNENVANNIFVYYSLKYNAKKIESIASGSTFKEVSGTTLKNFEIVLPPLEEQEKIANTFYSLDQKIKLNHQINSTLEKISQTLFKHWFIDFEFPDENGNPYRSSGGRMIDSELGEIPEGWKVKQIGDVCQTFGGGTPKTSEPSYWEEGDIFWATPTDMTSLNSPVIFDTARKITEKGLQNSSAKLLPVGSILMTSRATLGYFAITKVPISTNQGFISMVCDDKISNYYLLSVIKNKMDEIKNLAGGSTYPEINKTSFRSIEIILPPQNEMKKFNEITDPIYEKIFQNELEIKRLSEIRDSLLPKLMSGKIRIKN